MERKRVKYQEEDEEHSSDLRSDLEEMDYIPGPLVPEEEVDTIDFVLDHRLGMQRLSYYAFPYMLVSSFFYRW